LVSFGIAEKQKDKPRQAFEKSAIFVGFMNQSKDRLVEPVIMPMPTGERYGDNLRKILSSLPDQTGSYDKPKNPDDPLQEPLLQGLLTRLRPVGEIWEKKDRVKWLKTVANFTAIYDDHDDHDNVGEWEITVALKLRPPGG
jgi:hypothetical protein